MKARRILSLLLAMALCGGLFTLSVGAVDKVASGTCGESLTWTYYSDHRLVITGKGEMKSWDRDYEVPWYSYKRDIRTVVLPDGLTSIGSHAFDNYPYVTDIVIPDNVTKIGAHAFAASRLSSVSFPDSLTTIGSYAFYYCQSLHDITIPDGTTNINNNAFNGCLNLTDITLPDSVTYLGSYAFDSCERLTDIRLPCGLEEISEGLFYNCPGLVSITIPEGVMDINTKAFYGCSGLTSVTLPKSFVFADDSAFYGCTALTDVNFCGTAVERSRIRFGAGNSCLANATFHYNSSDVPTPADSEPDVPPVTFSIPTLKAYCGKAVTVPVNIADNPGLASVTLTVNYDPAVLAYTGAQISSAFSALIGATSLVIPQSGKVTLTWVVTSGECSADGVFAELSFIVLADAADGASPITITYNSNNICDEASENVPAQAENGAVNVSRCLPGDVNGDGKVNNKDAVLTLRYAVGFSANGNVDAMDVNADGSVDAKDALLLLRYAAGFDVVLK